MRTYSLSLWTLKCFCALLDPNTGHGLAVNLQLWTCTQSQHSLLYYVWRFGGIRIPNAIVSSVSRIIIWLKHSKHSHTQVFLSQAKILVCLLRASNLCVVWETVSCVDEDERWGRVGWEKNLSRQSGHELTTTVKTSALSQRHLNTCAIDAFVRAHNYDALTNNCFVGLSDSLSRAGNLPWVAQVHHQAFFCSVCFWDWLT